VLCVVVLEILREAVLVEERGQRYFWRNGWNSVGEGKKHRHTASACAGRDDQSRVSEISVCTGVLGDTKVSALSLAEPTYCSLGKGHPDARLRDGPAHQEGLR